VERTEQSARFQKVRFTLRVRSAALGDPDPKGTGAVTGGANAGRASGRLAWIARVI
jgi:hypothetical protein